MSQINPLENVITHERTFYLDTANVSRAESLAGWYLKIIDVSSANVKIKLRVDNEQTEAKTMKLGAGWRHRWFERLVFDWDAQPGEWITVEYGGNPATYRPELYESFVPSVTTSVEVSNTTANAVPVKGNGTPLPVAPVGNTPVTQATEPWIITQDRTPFDVTTWLPAGGTALMVHSAAAYGATPTTTYTVPTGKVAYIGSIAVGGGAERDGFVWVEDGSGNTVWVMAVTGGNRIEPSLTLPAGYLIRGISYYSNHQITVSGYVMAA